MFKSILFKVTKIKIGNLLFDRLIRLLYTILSLYLGANFLINQEFFILQQITLFQSFLLFAICLPVNSILVRLGNSSIEYFKSLLISTLLLRFVTGIISICLFSFYLLYANFNFLDILLIILGLTPTLLGTIFIIDILPHVFNFEGRKNWELIFIYLFFFIIKCLSIVFLKSLVIKISIELIEICLVILWNYKTYLVGLLSKNFIQTSNIRVKKLVKSSSGLYFNGILSVFILRIDQFALINFVDKQTLSSYMLIVSITSLFLTPMGLLSERLAYVMSIAKSQSLAQFNKISVKYLYIFAFLSLVLYLIFSFLFLPISQFVFNRDLSEFLIIALILGTTIISNSLGMIFGQINSTLNGGMFTMRRSLIGCMLLFIGVNIGFKLYGIIGVAIASASTLLITNIIFWFFSKKIRRVIFNRIGTVN